MGLQQRARELMIMIRQQQANEEREQDRRRCLEVQRFLSEVLEEPVIVACLPFTIDGIDFTYPIKGGIIPAVRARLHGQAEWRMIDSLQTLALMLEGDD